MLEEKTFSWRFSIASQTTSCDNAVNVRMIHKILSPGMENSGNAGNRTKICMTGTELKQSLGHRMEEECISGFLAAKKDGIQLFGQGKDDVKIVGV